MDFWIYLQEAVSAAYEVSSFHDRICSENQLVLTERRLIWTCVDRLGGTEKIRSSAVKGS